ncbi:CRISPR-associated endonuclease Cas2 [Phormidium sp. CCY1219]|uniref:CRISPR-associated endonuclease Cas2 n=1 Tax=Phormidium sp. CCY1219 TaxID=2886104 RepID=UPI002D1F8954|nr:CRISPR-associated endonuclease Cas2 [Phormidium sp. CCY1219]MEB3825871.1 CRISPR-associated endonuclease Cas2 [Phormidium sp. CCY1219]
MLFYVIVYDIPCNKRRQKVHDLLKAYGTWVQYSTFECRLTQSKFKELCQKLRKKVNFSQDSLRFYPLSSHTMLQIQSWGIGPPTSRVPESVVI